MGQGFSQLQLYLMSFLRGLLKKHIILVAPGKTRTFPDSLSGCLGLILETKVLISAEECALRCLVSYTERPVTQGEVPQSTVPSCLQPPQ